MAGSRALPPLDLPPDRVVLPLIDYAQHPGFKGLTFGPDDPDVNAAVARIDVAVRAVHESPRPLGTERLRRELAGNVDPVFTDLRKWAADRYDPATRVFTRINDALEQARTWLLDEACFRDAGKSYRRNPAGVAGRVAEEMTEHGICCRSLHSAAIRELRDLAEPHRRRFEARAANGFSGRQAISVCPTETLWRRGLEIINGTGFVAGGGAYQRHEYEVGYLALEYSNERQDWWRDCYADVGLPTSPAVYMHFDQDFGLLKAMIYLDPVDELQGPFHFIRGSTRWQRSPFQSTMFKALDVWTALGLGPCPEFRTPYYRIGMKHPATRADFAARPRAFRGTSHFGDDLVAGTEPTDWFLTRETRYTSDAANCILFDGGRGVHRGGCVQRGSRWALQVGLNLRAPLLRRLRRRAWRTVLPTLFRGKRLAQRMRLIRGAGIDS